jgi:hypothetical protein
VCGAFLVALGAVALLETLRLRDGWLGARLMTLATAAAIALASHVVFKHWLGMPLPAGSLG